MTITASNKRRCLARAKQAENVLCSYTGMTGGTFEESQIDLLADLRHYCDRANINFGDLLRRSYTTYLMELHE